MQKVYGNLSPCRISFQWDRERIKFVNLFNESEYLLINKLDKLKLNIRNKLVRNTVDCQAFNLILIRT